MPNAWACSTAPIARPSRARQSGQSMLFALQAGRQSGWPTSVERAEGKSGWLLFGRAGPQTARARRYFGLTTVWRAKFQNCRPGRTRTPYAEGCPKRRGLAGGAKRLRRPRPSSRAAQHMGSLRQRASHCLRRRLHLWGGKNLTIQLVFAGRHDGGHRGITGHIDRSTQHVEQAINANDQRNTLDG